MDKVYSLYSVKKKIDRFQPRDHCDVCGREITEPPYMNMTTTICSSCFWDWIQERRKKQCNSTDATDAEQQ